MDKLFSPPPLMTIGVRRRQYLSLSVFEDFNGCTVYVNMVLDVFSANRRDRQHSGIGTAYFLSVTGQPISSQGLTHDIQKVIHRPNVVHTTYNRSVYLRARFPGTQDFGQDQRRV
jgi:hypothetical protein